MEYIEFIFYGLIQGLTEFIPVSSTAHLKIISNQIGLNDPGPSVSAIIQLGSVLAIFWYFRNDIRKLYKSRLNNFVFYNSYKKLAKSIFIGTLPIIFLGGIIRFYIFEFFDSNLRSDISIAIISIFMAILMFFADITKSRFICIKNHKYIDSFLIGIAQAFAIIPGVSRSGITISTALLTGWERGDATRFSFLLGIPAISIPAISELIFSVKNISEYDFYPLVVGLIVTFISSLISINFLIR